MSNLDSTNKKLTSKMFPNFWLFPEKMLHRGYKNAVGPQRRALSVLR